MTLKNLTSQAEAEGSELEVPIQVPISGEEAQEVEVKVQGQEVRERKRLSTVFMSNMESLGFIC